MAKRRGSRSRRSSNSNTKLPKAAQVVAFTEDEEAFFRAGAACEQSAPTESFDDLDVKTEMKVSFWRRLFSRVQTA